MKEALLNLLRLEPQNEVWEMYAVAVLVWLVVVAVSLSSVFHQRLGRLGKALWSMAILGLPLVGLFAYSVYAFAKTDHSGWFGFFALRQSESSRRPARGGGAGTLRRPPGSSSKAAEGTARRPIRQRLKGPEEPNFKLLEHA